MRFLQSEADGTDFKKILDANAGALGRSVDLLMPRERRNSQMSFNSFNVFSATFSFGPGSQQGEGDQDAANGKRKGMDSLAAILKG